MSSEPGVRDQLTIGPPGSQYSMSPPEGPAGPGAELTYEYGLEIEARSQWAYARRRFVRHRLALGSLIVLLGIFGGWIDNLLMRVTDLFLTLPLLAVLLVAAKYLGHSTPLKLALLLACLIWTQIARIVRGSFLSLREKEYVEAARAAGAGDLRIMLRHMIPNTIGPIVVSATLTIGTAILLEAVLSFLGFGIEPPTPALGGLLNEGQDQGIDKWWLVTFPGVVIVLIVLCINFVGDGLRDALDPTQRRVRA